MSALRHDAQPQRTYAPAPVQFSKISVLHSSLSMHYCITRECIEDGRRPLSKMNVISSVSFPHYRISAIIEDGRELKLSWVDSGDSDGEGCSDDGIECIYNESNTSAVKILPSSSVSAAATISTCDSSSIATATSSLSSHVENSSLLRADEHSLTSTEHEDDEEHDPFTQHGCEDETFNLCPVTGRYSNLHDHYYTPKSSSIGIGQYGQVHSCVHIATGKVYAVKTILKSQLDQRLHHIYREIDILTKVTDHPNILKLVDYREDQDSVHIITEKYNGGELFDLIGENTSAYGCLSEGLSASIIKQVLEALDYLHSKDIAHRDVKPENILFESELTEYDCHDLPSSNSIRLIDFGLAREHNIARHGYMTSPVGTSYYMAPECLKEKYTKACDIWSAGIVTYIMLCGYPPFNGPSEADIQQTVLDHGSAKNVNFNLRGWAGKSEEAKDFIRCLLRRDPRKRFTAREALMHPWLKMYC